MNNAPRELLTLLILAVSCAHAPTSALRTARVTLEPRSGSSVAGEGEFAQEGDEVVLTLHVTGAKPGMHAVHLHEKPDCRAADAASAGGHWNPGHAEHGKFDRPPFHLGDLGNLQVGDDGQATLRFSTPRWSVGTGAENDVVHRALVIHADVDDLISQPAGNAGSRVACGVVVASAP